ncbi:hypothetical protein L7F22_022136 [Adiantum nelumboides]|nr:hypothetical protein [Adiantum nelumboides]
MERMISRMIRAKVSVPHEIIRAELAAPPLVVEALTRSISFLHTIWELPRDRYARLALESSRQLASQGDTDAAPPLVVEALTRSISFLHTIWELPRDKYACLALESSRQLASQGDTDVGTLAIENCNFSWSNNISSFKAGEQAALRVLLVDYYDNIISSKTGRQTFYSFSVFSNSSSNEVLYDHFNVSFDTSPGYEKISFTPTTAGDFVLHVLYNEIEAPSSPFNFSVTAGPISIPNCQGIWLDNVSSFTAGEEASLQVLMMDSYDNSFLSQSENLQLLAYVMDITGKRVAANTKHTYDGNSTYQLISFNTSTAGDLVLQVERDHESIAGSPFPFHVDPGIFLEKQKNKQIQGSIYPTACQGFWPLNVSTFEVGETATFGILYMDSFNNSLNVSYASSANISATIDTEVGSKNLSVLSTDSQGGPGYGTIELISFSSGKFILHVTIGETEISGSPFFFEFSAGAIYAPNCLGAWQTGNTSFTAGTYPTFNVLKKDEFNNTITSSFDEQVLDFKVYSMTDGGVVFNLDNLTSTQNESSGAETLMFLTSHGGTFLLHVEYNGTKISGSPFVYVVVPGPISVAQCIGYWGNGSGVYSAGDTMSLYVLLKDAYGNNITASKYTSSFAYFTVRTKTLAGALQSMNVTLTAQNDSGYEAVIFNNKRAGNYLLYVTMNSSSIDGSPFPYTVQPGVLSTPDCQVLWLNKTTDIKAGSQASAEVLFVDAFNNSVSSYINFTMYFMRDGQSFEDVSVLSRRELGNQQISFIITLPGDYSFHLVNGGSNELNGSPLNFSIIPASVSPPHCKGAWVDEVNSFKVGDSGALKIFLMDPYNNIVSASSEEASTIVFSAYITSQNGAKKSDIPIVTSLDASKIYEILNFNPVLSGRCLLYVLINKVPIEGSPFTFTLASGLVFIPYCSGSWLNSTNVFERGQQVMLKVILKDDLNTTLSSITNFTFTKMRVMDLRGKATKMMPKLISSEEPGIFIVTFNITSTLNSTTKGDFLLCIGDASSQIQGSPFLFSVLPVVDVDVGANLEDLVEIATRAEKRFGAINPSLSKKISRKKKKKKGKKKRRFVDDNSEEESNLNSNFKIDTDLGLDSVANSDSNSDYGLDLYSESKKQEKKRKHKKKAKGKLKRSLVEMMDMSVHGYADSDYVGSVDSRKSTSGYVFTVAGGPVLWASRLHPCIALSTTKAKYMPATKATKESLWLSRLVGDLEFVSKQSVPLSSFESVSTTKNLDKVEELIAKEEFDDFVSEEKERANPDVALFRQIVIDEPTKDVSLLKSPLTLTHLPYFHLTIVEASEEVVKDFLDIEGEPKEEFLALDLETSNQNFLEAPDPFDLCSKRVAKEESALKDEDFEARLVELGFHKLKGCC